MTALYNVLAWIFISITFIPLIKNTHWIFRIWDFGKIQIFIFQFVLIVASPYISYSSSFTYLTSVVLLFSTIYNGVILYKYTPLFNANIKKSIKNASETISIISTNVFQDNTDFDRFLALIKKQEPNLVLTMESDKNWDQALTVLDKDYPYAVKIPLQNTYGMHLFSNLKIKDSKVNFFVSPEIPSIEATLETTDGESFKIYALHPPPPSPTEEKDSTERDGDLLSVAKSIRNDKDIPTVAIGDFNCVAWAEASTLFTKTSEMVDPRLGRGFLSTFHAKYWFLRFPIDQVYHTPDIFVEELKTLPNIGSDHLPLSFKFVIDKKNTSQEDLVPEVTKEELKTVDKKIEEGIMKKLILTLLIAFTSLGSFAQNQTAIAIHGGAGTITRKGMTPEMEKAYKDGLTKALKAGHKVLQNGGSSLDAVQTAVIELENNPLFNAGKGAVFTHEGKNEMDASIMDGKTLKAGAITGVSTLKNPIKTARKVMDKSVHVLLSGKGAEEFAKIQGEEIVDPSYFFTEKRWEGLQKALKNDKTELDHADTLKKNFPKTGFNHLIFDEGKKFGTVGAVALDKSGNIAAATSTGGMTNKRWNRIGDSPIIGAGTYANNETCAVSATGHGEYFIRSVVSYDISALMEYKNLSVSEAAQEVVMKKLVKRGGEGGVIAIDNKGNISMPFNTEGMYRASIDINGNVFIGIYKDDTN